MTAARDHNADGASVTTICRAVDQAALRGSPAGSGRRRSACLTKDRLFPQTLKPRRQGGRVA
jgi:hypothetical protein